MSIILIIVAIIVAIVIILLATAYLWPQKNTTLQSTDYQRLSYDSAVEVAHQKQKDDTLHPGLEGRCDSQLLTHGTKTDKAVILMHGITACPDQYNSLAKTFFEAGYNVYVPLAPHHGTTDKTEHRKVKLSELKDYMDTSLAVGTGLGDSLGVVGLSGGAVLGTWMAEYSRDVSRLLVLSPFYEPSTAAAPKWQLPLLKNLYGNDVLPDKFTDGFSLRTLAKYLIVKTNYRVDNLAPGLRHVALATSPNDQKIDLPLANQLPKDIASANQASFSDYSLAKDLNIGHDIVGAYSDEVKQHQSELNRLYLALYENTETDSFRSSL